MKIKKILFLFLLCSFAFAEDGQKNNLMPSQDSAPIFSTQMDILYWKVEEGGLDFICDQAIDIPTNHGLGGDLKRAMYDWHPGFRVAAAFGLAYDKWCIEGDYFLFHPTREDSVLRHEGAKMQGTFPQFVADMYKATSTVDIRFHCANLFLTKEFRPANKISLKFLSGLAAAWIKHNWEVVYFGDGNDYEKCHIKPKWRFKGAGPAIGANFDWILGYGFNWTGKALIATIYGNYDNKIRSFTVTTSKVTQIVESSHLDDFRLATHIQLYLGPSWEKHFSTCNLKLFAGYETNVWFNINQINREEFHSATSENNPQTRHVHAITQLSGLTFYVRIDI